MLTMGVDIGSTASKAVIIRDGKEIVARQLVAVGTGTRGPQQVYQGVLAQAGVVRADIARVVATGYGRLKFAEADRELSEVSCHGRGISFLCPGIRTVIDIGGQDAKALALDLGGNLENFIMNDKCAAGTGRFLEAMARVLDIPVEEMGMLSAQAQHPVSISSTCAVFAESEVISRLAAGEQAADIVAGIHASVARKVSGLAVRAGVHAPIAMSGGVAKNRGIVEAMERELHSPITVPEDCQLAGAIGAALFAYRDLKSVERS
ncbi:MAG: acyl-CoA dehydratase activase [Eubacteriales bacterium]|nr:acyl-CoA dehydratase activase [Eubacteriales bacterium]